MSDSVSTYPVYLGIWTNWAQGPVLGKTLTVTRSDGTLLIAFAAFFVTLVGSQLWRIICFALHHLYSTPQEQDALYHQRQAILRNSGSPMKGVWEFLELALAWRQARVHSFTRLFPAWTCAVISGAALIIASGFSSRISLGNEVLIAGDSCGIITIENATQDDFYRKIKPYETRISETAADYTQRCYQGKTEASDCSVLARAYLPTIVDTKAKCPFNNSLCLSEDANIFLDTGLLDSHRDLGINAPKDSRFQYRQTLHCAPLVTSGFKSNVTDKHDRTFTRYMYGPTQFSSLSNDCNCSFAVPNDILTPSRRGLSEATGTEYRLRVLNAGWLNGTLLDFSGFAPISEFNRVDGHLHLISLSSNTVGFMEKSEDLWYRATSPVRVQSAKSGDEVEELTFWEATEPTWPLGCVSQYQWCDSAAPSTDRCTQLSGSLDVEAEADASLGGDIGKKVYWVMETFAQGATISGLLNTLGSRSLTSRFGLTADMMQTTIEPNQWHLDVMNWFNITLASLQLHLVDTAIGPARGFAPLEDFIQAPSTKEQKEICASQIIHSAQYMSFSLLGLLLIFVVGAFIILVSSVLEPLTSLIQKHFKFDTYPGLEWRTTQKLQLQRLAYEELGYGQWTIGVGGVPITSAGEKMAVLDVSDLKKGRFADPYRDIEVGDGGRLVTQESNGSCEEARMGDTKKESDGTFVATSDVTPTTGGQGEKAG